MQLTFLPFTIKSVLSSILCVISHTRSRTFLGLPVIVAGGVLANRRLRAALSKSFAHKNRRLLIPELRYCTDNAAMVAAAAHLYFSRGIESRFTQITTSNSFGGNAVSKTV